MNPDDLRFAAEWLRQYDDMHDVGEQTAIACKVADWLDRQAMMKETRDACRAAGVPVALLRRKLKNQKAARIIGERQQ